MLVVASDRISVFDVVLPDLIPDKGRVLTALSTFWFEQTAHLVPNHLVSSDPTDFPETAGPDVAGRAMLVQAAQPVRLECVARGYLFGSAWSEYQETGTVRGRPLPAGLRQAERLPGADLHAHHQGRQRPRPPAHRRRGRRGWSAPTSSSSSATLTLADLPRSAPRTPRERGLILADTKLEFGLVDGRAAS